MEKDYGSKDVLQIRIPNLSFTIFNIYKDTHTLGGGTPSLINTLNPLSRSILIEDFNAIKTRWTNRSGQRPHDEEFEEWTVKMGFELLSTSNVPTYNRGNVLNLA